MGKSLVAANGGRLAPVGQCTARVTIDNATTIWTFCVLPTCPHEVILGWDFLSSCGAAIDWAQNTVDVLNAAQHDDPECEDDYSFPDSMRQ